MEGGGYDVVGSTSYRTEEKNEATSKETDWM